MSAICGVVGLDGRPWTERDLEGMRRGLAPLGRDGGGAWAGTAGRTGVAVGAALRRSTPEDTADRQPAESRNGSLVLVADLRLDNRDELASSLGLTDHPSVPDSAFVLAAYERWGESFLDRLVGEFALAIVDRPRGGVLIARDVVGARPLSIHVRPNVAAFASTALALTGFEGIGHALDTRRAIEVLANAYSSERTFVEGVRSVPPATKLWIDADGTRRSVWWTPDPHDIVDLGSPAAHEQELRGALDRAVAAQLRSTGGVGVMMSGGLDSTSVAATAALQLAPEPLRTYTSAPPRGWSGVEPSDRDADESPLVAKLAELHPNLSTNFVYVPRGESLFEPHERLWELGSGPARNPCNMLWIHVIAARATADGVSTLLSGGRGNTYFSADGPAWIGSLLRRGRLATALREAAGWARISGEGLYGTLRRIASPLLPVPVQRLARRASGRTGTPMKDWLASIALRPEIAADLDLEQLVPVLDEHNDPRALAMWLLQDGASHAETQAALAGLRGVEERDPTVDRRLLEVAMRQPEWVRRHDGVTRAVVRGAMGDRLPAEIVNRTRRGEQLPDWLDVMTASRPELVCELEQLEDHPTSRQLIDTDRLRDLMNRWPDPTAGTDQTVMRDYRLALLRSLHVSRYLRWFERRAAEAASTKA